MAVQSAWSKYRETRDRGLREALTAENLHLVRHIAGRLAVRLPPSIGREDLEGWGMFGLMDAVDRYEPDRGFDFGTYASHRIRGAMLDELRKVSPAPRSVWRKLRKFNDARERVEGRSGVPATDAELAGVLGMKPEKYRQLKNFVNTLYPLSLDDLRVASDGRPASYADLIGDHAAPDPVEAVLEREERKVLADAVGLLNEKDQLVIRRYYEEGLTLKELGRALGITEARVCQLHSRALARLRAKVREKAGGETMGAAG